MVEQNEVLTDLSEAVSEPVDLRDPRLYINRELSMLEFNYRVLEEALDDSLPLLERVKFLAKPARTAGGFFISCMAAESNTPGVKTASS